MEVWLGGRLLLAPRQADLPLLQAVLSASGGTGGPKSNDNVYDLEVNWAQIALVYRQRDFERIMDLCHQELRVSATSQHRKAQSSEELERSPTPTPSTGSRSQLKYRFNIGAPLLFLPASSGKKCDLGVMDPRSSIGGLSSANSSSHRSFQPLRDEGYAVLDFGNCLVQSDPSSAGVRISMTRLQVFFAASFEEDESQKWHQILRPVTAEVEVQSTAESLDIRVHAPLEKVESLDVGLSVPLNPLKPSSPSSPSSYKPRQPRPLPTISLTRAHATQFFDVLYLNLSYASADQVEAIREALKMRLQQLEELTQPTQPAAGRGFLFSLRWTGALMVEAGFTESSTLARLEIMNGCFEYRRPPSAGEAVPRHINFFCQGGCVKDARNEDFIGMLIDLPCADGRLGLEVLATMPALPTDFAEIKIELRQCQTQTWQPFHVILCQSESRWHWFFRCVKTRVQIWHQTYYIDLICEFGLCKVS